MIQGTVKKWDDQRGFGFLTHASVEEDIFVHYSDIDMRGRRSLEVGQLVEFELGQGPKGAKATKVRPVGATAKK